MQGHEILFDGRFKKYTGKKIKLELKDDARPVHCKAFILPICRPRLLKGMSTIVRRRRT
jgi:hypothetical protein